jgi:hypothetical protein
MYGGKLVYPWQLKVVPPVESLQAERQTRNKAFGDTKDTEPVVEEPVICRFALHASTLEFRHPTTEEMVKFEAPLPEDMQNLLVLLRKYRKV